VAALVRTTLASISLPTRRPYLAGSPDSVVQVGIVDQHDMFLFCLRLPVITRMLDTLQATVLYISVQFSYFIITCPQLTMCAAVCGLVLECTFIVSHAM